MGVGHTYGILFPLSLHSTGAELSRAVREISRGALLCGVTHGCSFRLHCSYRKPMVLCPV